MFPQSNKALSPILFSLFLLLAIVGDSFGKPLKVFILAGQSNMQGHAKTSTFQVMDKDPKTAPLLGKMVDKDGEPVVCDDVWISSIGSATEEKTGQLTAGFGAENNGPKIGPEFTFGITMQELTREPILIIKTAWGGKSLHTDFRPPNAGPSPKAGEGEASGHYYRLMVEHVKKVLADIKQVYPGFKKNNGYELAGFVWFQGWNDMVDGSVYPQRYQPGGYDAYTEVLVQFIKDIRQDLSAPNLPFIIGVMGVGGPTELYDSPRYKEVHQYFRDAMAAPATMDEFKDTVTAVLTEHYWDMELAALRKKEQPIKKQINSMREQVKNEEMDKDEADETEEKLYEDTFTEDELFYLRNGASNAEFHYLGSAKILGQIGKAFAEANYKLLKN